MNEVIDVFPYSARTMGVTIHNAMVARRAKPGNFIILRFSEKGPRLPFAIIDTNPENETLEIIIHRAEGLDDIQKLMRKGSVIPDLLGPLGKTPEIDSAKNVLCCGDGAGFVPLLPIIRALHENGCSVMSVMSEKSDKTTCISEEIENYSDKVVLASDSDLMNTIEKAITERGIEKVWMSGPTGLLKEITAIAARHNIPADCILNMIMIDGIGLCGTCRVIVNGERKQTCTDGPVFNAHHVDFDQLANRQRLFK